MTNRGRALKRADGSVPAKYLLCAGYFACNNTVQVGRPTTKEELLSLIKAFPLVRGVGVGHSWFEQLFCAGSTADSIDIVLTEISATKRL